jgi:tetratricopeptide (TPR) repeat protein
MSDGSKPLPRRSARAVAERVLFAIGALLLTASLVGGFGYTIAVRGEVPYRSGSHLSVAESLSAAGHHDAAAAEYRAALAVDSTNALPSVRLAQELVAAGRSSEAMEALRQGTESTFDPRVHIQYARVLDSVGQWRQGRRVLERLAQLHPENAIIYGHLGSLLARHAELEAAKTVLERALELDPELHALRTTLDAVLEQQRGRGSR